VSTRIRVVLAVVAGWTLVGVVSGTQAALGANMQGEPVPFGPAVRTALVNFLPWIPATLAVIALALRFPVTRETWTRNLWIHIAAIPVVTYAVNVLVVLGFWTVSGSLSGPGELLRQGAFWTAIRLHVGFVIYAAIAGVTQAARYFAATRARELHVARLESQLARARLQALNAQIRPHFLFNTLHTIGQMWRSGRSDEADGLLDRLGSLFQRVQSTASEAVVPLEEELALVREYLAIERVRFRDRLTVDVHATSEALACSVPPLLLQPLVENAVRHGISVSSRAGRVEVDARTDDGRLRIEVRDDGPGMIENAASRGSGTGLSNTRERLAELYGESAVLETGSCREGGFLARVELPARRWAMTEPATA